MVDQDDGASLGEAQSRPPTLDDVLKICGALNRAGAKYVVVGGMAVIQLGFVRATEDIDLLVDSSHENLGRLKRGLSVLQDNAVREVDEGDLDRYVVIRVADEVVVDLMKTACGVDYEAAVGEIETVPIEGVDIPFASARLLWRLKQTVRAKDEVDRAFLRGVLSEQDRELLSSESHRGHRALSRRARGLIGLIGLLALVALLVAILVRLR